MTQRIKPADADSKTFQDKYSRELQLLHQLAREAMKSKQTTNLSHVQNMRDLIKSFSLIYLKEKGVTPN
jgi:hypothetical protein